MERTHQYSHVWGLPMALTNVTAGNTWVSTNHFYLTKWIFSNQCLYNSSAYTYFCVCVFWAQVKFMLVHFCMCVCTASLHVIHFNKSDWNYEPCVCGFWTFTNLSHVWNKSMWLYQLCVCVCLCLVHGFLLQLATIAAGALSTRHWLFCALL